MDYYSILRIDTGEYYSTEGGYGTNVGVKWTSNPYHAAFGDRGHMIAMLRLLLDAGFKVALE